MPMFSNLDLRKGSGPHWRDWTLLKRLDVGSGTIDGLYLFSVPAGFVTDGASVPRILWSIFSPTQRWMQAAVAHDYLCTMLAAKTPVTGFETRRKADALFHAGCLSDGTNKVTAWLLYSAVRLYGIFGPH